MNYRLRIILIFAFSLVVLSLGILLLRHQRSQSLASKPPLGIPSEILAVGNEYFPPFCYLENNAPHGHDIDILRELEKRLGVKITIRLMGWKAAMDMVREGTADVLIGVSQLDERRAHFDFTERFLTLKANLFCRTEDFHINSLNDLPGSVLVGAEMGDVVESFVRSKYPQVQLKSYPNQGEALQALNRREIGLVVGDYFTGRYNIQRLDLTDKIKIVGRPLPLEGVYCLGVKKNRPELLQALNDGLDSIKQDGVSKQIQDKWFGEGAFSQPVGWTYVSYVLIAVSCFAAVLTLWNALLRRAVHQKSRQIEEKEQKYREIFNAVNDAIFIQDLDTGALLDVNDAMLRLYGCTREEAADLVFSSGSPEGAFSASDARQWIQKTMTEGPQEFEWRARRKDGEMFWAEVSMRVAEISGRRRLLALLRDISGRKREEAAKAMLEAQLRQSQKMEAVGTLAGGIAHDFNNILGAILGFAELAKAETQGNPEAQDCLKYILAASHRAKDLVKQILAFSRQSKQERKPTALETVARETMKLLRSSLPATIEITCDVAPNLPMVLADPTQIHQVLMNLGTNAAHAMRDTMGRLEVELSSLQIDVGLSRSHPDLQPGAYVRLRVTDTGHGMPPEIVKRVFDPFFTTKAPGEGTGLGLSVVHGIIEEHQGAIRVESQPGNGTTFLLYFPALPSETRQEPTAELEHLKGHGEHILFVDDEEALCKVGGSILKRLGYRVTTQSNPAKALQLFKENPYSFDLVLTDLTMPRLTGIDLATAILQIRPELPVVVATGFGGSWTREMAQDLGIGDVIAKPLGLEELGRALQLALPPRPSSPQLAP